MKRFLAVFQARTGRTVEVGNVVVAAATVNEAVISQWETTIKNRVKADSLSIWNLIPLDE